MRVFTVFFLITFLLFSVAFGVTDEISFMDEVPAADNLLTLSIEEIQMVSQAFSFVCDQMSKLHVAPEQVVPYLYFFVQKCERLVLEEGSFPFDFAVDVFDVQFISDIGGASDSSNSGFYSQLAIHLLRGVWQNSFTSNMESFTQLEAHGPEGSFNPAFAYLEEIYISSAVLSALVDGPHDSFSDRFGIPVDLLLSVSEKRKIIAVDNLYRKQTREQIGLLTERVAQSQADQLQGEQDLRKFAISLIVLPILFSINVLAVVIVFFAVRRRKRR